VRKLAGDNPAHLPQPESYRLMTMRREQLTKAEAVTVAAVEAGVPALAAARKMLDRFHSMLWARDEATLTT
jgi:hypothetical protein